MPFIHIKSLPLDSAVKVSAVVEGITKDFARGTGIEIEHVTATWSFFSQGHYAVAGKAADQQPENSHPLLVDLLTPDFNDAAQIEKMLLVAAKSISKRTQVAINNIFINHGQAHSGMVFDDGEVVHW
jgi:phenylpyruvate tautomerase PptA (4-oxalocrotonate tautomerase family)